MTTPSRLAMGRRPVRTPRRATVSPFVGRVFAPPETPPVFVGQPFNTLNLILPGASDVTIGTIKKALTSQSGVASATKFEFRIQSVQVWSDSLRVTVSPIDFLRADSSTSVELTTISSNGMKNAWARAGYVWPEAHRQSVLYSEQADMLIVKIAPKSVEAHLKILWKGAEYKLSRPEETLVESTNSLTREEFSLRERLAALEARVEESLILGCPE